VDLRERIGQEVREILKTQGTTALLVTHDQHEAFAIADEIGVMNEGEIQQWDSAYNLYHRPANRFVADFVGEGVLMPGTVLNERQVETELGTISGEIPLECNTGCPVDVLLRPDDILHDDASTLQAEVAKKAFRGADILYTLQLPSGRKVLSLVPSHHNHAIGGKIGIRLAVDHVVTFKQNPDSLLRAQG
jgi:iron(III) transport system ATP-binding protein